jgi:chemotaxis regulatin CheY-phosphate phosphatase CheZ
MSGEEGVRESLLSDSEATLRQVENVLSDFATNGQEPTSDVEQVPSGREVRPKGLSELVKVLVTTYSEIMEVIESLRSSRGLLEKASMERLKNTHTKLAEVSSATEVAATGMLDSVDRALDLVDDLDSMTDESASTATRAELRDELHQIMDLLQFQDITAQQLGYASSVLFDIEQRMVQLARLFDAGIGLAGLDHAPAVEISDEHVKETCDPEASTLNAEGRQAVADEIFTVPGVD